jgi:hypothetical protein
VFASAAAFSAIASAVYDAAGWDAVAALGGGLAAAGVVLWAFEQLLARRGSTAHPAPLSETH